VTVVLRVFAQPFSMAEMRFRPGSAKSINNKSINKSLVLTGRWLFGPVAERGLHQRQRRDACGIGPQDTRPERKP
jgi:hypothetical protein